MELPYTLLPYFHTHTPYTPYIHTEYCIAKSLWVLYKADFSLCWHLDFEILFLWLEIFQLRQGVFYFHSTGDSIRFILSNAFRNQLIAFSRVPNVSCNHQTHFSTHLIIYFPPLALSQRSGVACHSSFPFLGKVNSLSPCSLI